MPVVMSSVCRVCLVRDVKMYSLKNRISEMYEKLTNTNLSARGPQAVCYICHSLLQRCHSFTEMALCSEKTLQDLLNKGIEASYENILKLNPTTDCLRISLTASTMQIMTLNNNYYSVHSPSIKQEVVTNEEEFVTSEEEFFVKDEFIEESVFAAVDFPAVVDQPVEYTTVSSLSESTNHEDKRAGRFTLHKIGNKIFVCNKCGKKFSLKTKLSAHIQTHNQVTFACDSVHSPSIKQELVTNEEEFVTSEEEFLVKDEFTEESVAAAVDFPAVVDQSVEYTTDSSLSESTNHEDKRAGRFTLHKIGNKIFVCNKCGKKFSLKTKLSAHIQTHNQVTFACDSVHSPSIKQELVTNEEEFVTSEEEFLVKDEFTEESVAAAVDFPAVVDQSVEYTTDSSLSESTNHEDKRAGRFTSYKIGNKIFVCNECGKKFSLKTKLSAHIQTHNQVTFACDICNEKFKSKHYLNKHLINTHKKEELHMTGHINQKHKVKSPYVCDVCHKICSKSNLTRHMRTHTDERSYACNVCDKSFSIEAYRTVHLRTHTGERPYACDVCDKSFNAKSNLNRHMRTHTGERPYACDGCDKRFIVKGHLNRHMRTHSGEKPYACDVCDKSFNVKGDLNRHMRTHTGERPYACDVCDKKFTRKNSLILHMRTHSGERPYACDVCDKRFIVKGHLIIHMRTHSGEKPYACDVCDMSFNAKSNLYRHMRTHTGKKPYACDVCDKSFSQRPIWTRHMRAHTE